MFHPLTGSVPFARSHVSSLLAAGLLAVTFLAACSDDAAQTGQPSSNDSGFDTSGATDTSDITDVPDIADVDDVADGPQLSVCVLNGQGPAGQCANSDMLDFGSVAGDETAERLFRIDNEGGELAEFHSIEVDTDTDAFELRAVVYSQEADDPDAFERSVVQLPLVRQPGDVLYVEVAFTAGTLPEDLPADNVVVDYTTVTSSGELVVPMSGNPTGCTSGRANCDGDMGNGCETDLSSSIEHCGGCGHRCDLPNADEVTCKGGACMVVTCEEGFEDCDDDPANGCEVDLDSDLGHCGSCGNICDRPFAEQACNAGECEMGACEPDYADCNDDQFDGCEADLSSSLDHCGGCNQACELDNATAACDEGGCIIDTCDEGFEDCDGDPTNGCETNVNDDTANCGACENTCSAAGGEALCLDGSCTIDTCDEGYFNCDGDPANGCETNVEDDSDNCGGCGNVCTNPNGTSTCSEGACVPTCTEPWEDCDGDGSNGCETPVDTVDNCGACGITCQLDNATAACSQGGCEIDECHEGYADCDGDPANGCEVNLNNDLDNCGSCGTTCTNPNGATTCSEGTCSPTCNGLFDDCDGDVTNGCETSLDTLEDCGSCGMSCELDQAVEICSTGSCEIDSCEDGFSNCDGNLPNGCEVDTTSDVDHCGACDNTCTNPNGSTACEDGACAPTCEVGYGNCDGEPGDGCETPLNTLDNCGGCGITCDIPNASETCDSMVCEMAACDPGYADCDGDPSNGCEVNLNADDQHCGACGVSCENDHGTSTCSGGTCDPTCNSDYDDCNANPVDGCETPVTTTDNCGACGNTCELDNATEACTSQSCVIDSCDNGWGNCDGNEANGCETNLTSNAQNCGGCGITCTNPNGPTTCASGSCMPTCDYGYDDCNANPADGCETALDTVDNCGACGNTCELPNATPMCTSTGCDIATCDPGYVDCDGDPSNGCEVDITDDVDNCGACGNTCDNDNGWTTCSNGTCDPTCSSDYGNCDGDLDNGCETSLTTTSNCGSCGTTCSLENASQSCSTGSCEVTDCYGGWCDLNGNSYDGCEYDLDTNPSCGSYSHEGSVRGDQGNDTITISDRGEQWYRVRVTEADGINPYNDLEVKITLNSPTGTNYDLQAYCGSCSGSYDGSFSSGSVDSVGFRWSDSFNNTDNKQVYFKVVANYSIDVCDNWTVTVNGNTTTSSPSGC